MKRAILQHPTRKQRCWCGFTLSVELQLEICVWTVEEAEQMIMNKKEKKKHIAAKRDWGSQMSVLFAGRNERKFNQVHLLQLSNKACGCLWTRSQHAFGKMEPTWKTNTSRWCLYTVLHIHPEMNKGDVFISLQTSNNVCLWSTAAVSLTDSWRWQHFLWKCQTIPQTNSHFIHQRPHLTKNVIKYLRWLWTVCGTLSFQLTDSSLWIKWVRLTEFDCPFWSKSVSYPQSSRTVWLHNTFKLPVNSHNTYMYIPSLKVCDTSLDAFSCRTVQSCFRMFVTTMVMSHLLLMSLSFSSLFVIVLVFIFALLESHRKQHWDKGLFHKMSLMFYKHLQSKTQNNTKKNWPQFLHKCN